MSKPLNLLISYILMTTFSFQAIAAKPQATSSVQPPYVESEQPSKPKTKYKKPNKKVQTYIKLSDGRKLYSQIIETPEGEERAISFVRVNDSTGEKKYYNFLMMQQQLQELAKQNALAKTSTAIVKESTLKLPIDTATFFVAIGAVIAYQMMDNYAGNPLAMQQHFESLTDPVAHMAFYSFILANGFSADLITKSGYKRLDDIAMKKLFKTLPYKSMFWGSLASNLVSDIGGLLKGCASDLTAKKETFKPGQKPLFTHCEEALRQWTLPNKFHQYAPLIMSLYASQFLSEQIMNALTSAGSRANGLVATHLSFDIAASTGGRIFLKGFRIIGNPIIFMATDMVLTSPIAHRGWSVATDGRALKGLTEDFVEAVKYCESELNRGHISSSYSCAKLRDVMVDWKDTNQRWRGTLNADFDGAFASWSELIETFTNQTSTAQNFYSFVAEKIYAKEQFSFACNAPLSAQNLNTDEAKYCSALEAKGFSRRSFSLTRDYPLYGVLVDSQYLDSEKKWTQSELIKRIKNELLDHPNQIEDLQLKYVHQKVEEWSFSKAVPLKYLYAIDSIFKMLKENNAIAVGSGLKLLNETTDRRNTLYTDDRDLWDQLWAFRKTLGDPRPIMNSAMAFPYIYAGHKAYQEMMKLGNYSAPIHRYPYAFQTTSQYLLHEMMCANEKATMTHLPGFETVFRSFVPPRIIDSRVNTYNFCQHPREAKDTLYVNYFSKPSEFAQGQIFNSPTEFIIANRTGEIMPAVMDSKDYATSTMSKKSNFENWWLEKSQPTIDKFYAESQKEWLKIYFELIASFKNQGYVQDWTKRVGFWQNVKGFLTDLSSQTKNPLESIVQERILYFALLNKLQQLETQFRKGQKDQRFDMQEQALNDYEKASNDYVNYLKSIFTLDKSGISERVIFSHYYPSRAMARELRKNLAESTNKLKDAFTYTESSENMNQLARSAFYGIEGLNNELYRYLMAGFILDQDSIEDLNDMMAQLRDELKKMAPKTGNPRGSMKSN